PQSGGRLFIRCLGGDARPLLHDFTMISMAGRKSNPKYTTDTTDVLTVFLAYSLDYRMPQG
ncbi:MAG: hypothetical protein ACREVW_13375, partial [Burkholderiales bacterium]